MISFLSSFHFTTFTWTNTQFLKTLSTPCFFVQYKIHAFYVNAKAQTLGLVFSATEAFELL